MSKSINISSQLEEIMRSMESSDRVRSIAQQNLLPGFRFNPTDAELVGYYLMKKVLCKDSKNEVIALVDVYKVHPEDLPSMYSALCTNPLVLIFVATTRIDYYHATAQLDITLFHHSFRRG